MGWFTSDNDRFEVSATTKGWFGTKTTRRTVTGKSAANREARRLRRSGARDVRVRRGGWWASR